MMMSKSRVREDTPQPTMSVTDGTATFSMLWPIRGGREKSEPRGAARTPGGALPPPPATSPPAALGHPPVALQDPPAPPQQPSTCEGGGLCLCPAGMIPVAR